MVIHFFAIEAYQHVQFLPTFVGSSGGRLLLLFTVWNDQHGLYHMPAPYIPIYITDCTIIVYIYSKVKVRDGTCDYIVSIIVTEYFCVCELLYTRILCMYTYIRIYARIRILIYACLK